MKIAVLVSLLLALPALAQPRKYNLPPPDPAGQVSNPAKVVSRPEGKSLSAPAGFQVESYATGFGKPRELLQLPSGAVLVTESLPAPKGGVLLVAKGSEHKSLISGLDRPFGMAFHEGYLYVAEPEALKRYKIDPAGPSAGPAEALVAWKGYGKGHWTRSLAIDAKAKKIYASVGSGSNVDLGDPADRNAVNVYNLDGSGAEVFATGIRNGVCLRVNPASKRLWVTVQERDGLGDNLAPDFFTEVKKGAFYGWPYAYIGPNEDPRHKGVNPAAVAKSVEPDVLLGPHVSAMNFVFYSGKQFPAKYRGGAFVALRGSSGRSKRVGYSIVHVPFRKGAPAGNPETFVSGFMLGEDVKEVWGRPVGLVELADGSLLLSEDGNNSIWRISYSGK